MSISISPISPPSRRSSGSSSSVNAVAVHTVHLNRLFRMERDLYKQFKAAVGSFETMLRITTTERVYLSYQEHLTHLLKLIAAYHRAGLLSNDFFLLIHHPFSIIHDACNARQCSPEHHKLCFQQFRELIEKELEMHKTHSKTQQQHAQ